MARDQVEQKRKRIKVSVGPRRRWQHSSYGNDSPIPGAQRSVPAYGLAAQEEGDRRKACGEELESKEGKKTLKNGVSLSNER